MMTSLSALRTLRLPGIRQSAAGARHLLGVWRSLCSSTSIVQSRSRRLSAIAMIAALVTAASSTLIAQATRPEACVMTHHECDHTARITDCCCLASDASHSGGPIESRVQLPVDLSTHPVALPAGTFADMSRSSLQIHVPPLSVSLQDFTTRSAPLLI